jgi:alpha-L-rhamnosidase
VRDSLIREIKHWGHLTTGLRNTSLLLGYLAENGDIDLAYQLFIRREPPGLAANLKIGYGTFGETWASGEHPGVGSACQLECINAVPMFIPAYLAGIRPLMEEPGWKRFMIAPCIPAALNDLDFSFESPYGLIRSAWRRESGEIRLDVTVPPNTYCDLYIPQTDASLIRFEGGPASDSLCAGRTLYHLQAGQWSVTWPEASDAD